MRLPSKGPGLRHAGFALLPIVLAVAGLALDRRPATAESLLLNPPSGWNGIMVSGSVAAGWKQSGGAGLVMTPATTVFLAGPSFPPLVPGQVLTAAPASATLLPTSGDAKDKAQVTLSASVTVGDAGPTGFDTFNVSIFSETSAVNAKVDFGPGIGLQNADAVVIADFMLVTFAPIPAVPFATIGLPAIPALSAPPPNIETLTATARMGPYGAWTTTIVMGPGYAGSVLPLTIGSSSSDAFMYRLTYTITTPYGTDPSVSLAFEGSMETASVPEIGLMTLPVALLAALAGLLESRSRRPPDPRQARHR